LVDMIKIVEALTKKQMVLFATYPIKLYSKCKYYVPSIVDDEIWIKDDKKNLMKGNSVVRCFLAYNNNKIVGRVAGIIPVDANKKFNEKVLRISRIDFVEDYDVFLALINVLKEWAIQEGLEVLSGPWGFNDTDREGLLTSGFDQLSNYATAYSFPYYAKFFDTLGMTKESEWIEYAFDVDHCDPRFHLFAEKLKKEGYRDAAAEMPVKKVVKKYGDSFFDCYNSAYANLDNFVPIKGDAMQATLKQFATIVNAKFFSCIVDKNDNVVAFGVGLPHIGNALRRGKGRMILSALPILLTIKFPKRIELALIGVDPKFTNSGIHALVVDRFLNNFKKYKIKDVWMDPVLTTNVKMLHTWTGMEKWIRQTRQTYRINVNDIK